MGAINPQVLITLEDHMRILQENSYAALSKSENLWYKDFVKVIPSMSRKELMFWFLSTAQIRDQGYSGGNLRFDDMVMLETSYENKDSGNGFEMSVNELSDLDGNGVKAAAKWATDMGHMIAYYPQKQTYTLLAAGESTTCYDGQCFFSTAHPYNPYNSAAGTYKNLWTSSDAAPIDTSVSVDIAFNNLLRILGEIQGIKQADGSTPRFLKALKIGGAPKLMPRLAQLTSAKTIAQVAGTASYGAGGSADVEAIVSMMGLGRPVSLPEFAGVDDTSYYILCEWQSQSELGPIVYQNREPYRITYYTGQGGGTGVDAALDRARKLEWHNWGRNVAGFGHPFLLHKVKAT